MTLIFMIFMDVLEGRMYDVMIYDVGGIIFRFCEEGGTIGDRLDNVLVQQQLKMNNATTLIFKYTFFV